jgi:flagellar hook assembly protein FlgD
MGTGVVEFDPDNLPTHYDMSQSYPNPFNPTTTIEFNLPKRSHVTVKIYNLLGQQVQNLVDEELSVGNYKVTWDGSTSGGDRASTGVYFYRIVTEDFTETKKMVLLK